MMLLYHTAVFLLIVATSQALFLDALFRAAGLNLKPDQPSNAKEVARFQPPAVPMFAPAQPLQTPPPAQFALWRSQYLAKQTHWSPSLWPMVVSQVPISPSQVQNIDIEDTPIIVGTGYAFRPE